jgi:hypothetical protein
MTAKTKTAKSAKSVQAVAMEALHSNDAQAKGLLVADAMRAIGQKMASAASAKACNTAAGIITTHASIVGARLPEGWQGTLNRDSGKKLARIALAIATGTHYGRDPEAINASAHGRVDGSIPFYIRAMLDGESTRKGMLASAMTAERYKDAAGAQAGYARQALWLAGIATGNVSSKNAELKIVDRPTALALLPEEIRSQYASEAQASA